MASLSEAQKVERGADFESRLRQLKLAVAAMPPLPDPETARAEEVRALEQEHAAAAARVAAFQKTIAVLPPPATTDALRARFKEGTLEPPETIKYGAHASQFYRVHRPGTPEPWWVVLIIHGGFWRQKYNVDNACIHTVAPALARRGFCAVEVEYRRVGHGGGWPASCDDVGSALRHCVANVAGLSEKRVVLLGHSAGGHCALMCAAACEHPPRLLVLIAPVADLVHAHERGLSDDGAAVRDFVGAAPEEKPDLYALACPTRAEIWTRLRSDVVLATGDADADVPLELTRLFLARLDQELGGPRLLEYVEPAGDHYSVVDASNCAFAEIWEAAEGVLRRPGL